MIKRCLRGAIYLYLDFMHYEEYLKFVYFGIICEFKVCREVQRYNGLM